MNILDSLIWCGNQSVECRSVRTRIKQIGLDLHTRVRTMNRAVKGCWGWMVKIVSVKKWQLECRKCGCTFSCTSKDGKYHKFDPKGSVIIFGVQCPICGTVMTFPD